MTPSELELHPPGQDYVSDRIRQTGDWYEREVLEEIRRRRPGGVLVDVGAHLGNHTAYLAAFVEHTAIHAFEPVAASRQLLSRNTARFPSVIVHPEALGRDRARGYIGSPDPNNAGHAGLGHGSERVAITTLDSFHLGNVRLLKIDVEGHEGPVLAGAARTIARWRPLIVIEDWGDRLGDVMAEQGYRLSDRWPDRQTYLYQPRP